MSGASTATQGLTPFQTHPGVLARWGLLGPLAVAAERNTRTLGLGAAVRVFNDLTVPGLGGVWFAKPLVLAALGVDIARRRKRPNIEVANAVEALACRLELEVRGWAGDARLRGKTKLRGRDDLCYATVKRPSFYVTQPMRQQTVQPLMALGLVDEGIARFNAFVLSERGQQVIAAAFQGYRPYNKSVPDVLVEWVDGDRERMETDTLRLALSPINPLPEFCRDMLRDCLVQGSGAEAKRRRAAYDWINGFDGKSRDILTWSERPDPIDYSHWRDIRAGARFFSARDAALRVLDRVEAFLAPSSRPSMALVGALPKSIAQAVSVLREKADAFLAEGHDPSPEWAAKRFCRELQTSDDFRLIATLVARDGRGLCLRGESIVPGSAFRGDRGEGDGEEGSVEEEGAETPGQRRIEWLEGISPRINNLFLLSLDLNGRLEKWITPAPGPV